MKNKGLAETEKHFSKYLSCFNMRGNLPPYQLAVHCMKTPFLKTI